MKDLTGQQLSAVAEVLSVAGRLGVDVWLRGGWAMDFYLGRVTRAHEDIDWFAWGDGLPGLVDALIQRGWVDRAEHPPDQQRDLVRGAVELGFAPLGRDRVGTVVVGGSPWEGEAWPDGIVRDAVLGELGGVRCAVISPAVQVEIKRMMPVWVPRLPRRPKDETDIQLLLDRMSNTRP